MQLPTMTQSLVHSIWRNGVSITEDALLSQLLAVQLQLEPFSCVEQKYTPPPPVMFVVSVEIPQTVDGPLLPPLHEQLF